MLSYAGGASISPGCVGKLLWTRPSKYGCPLRWCALHDSHAEQPSSPLVDDPVFTRSRHQSISEPLECTPLGAPT